MAFPTPARKTRWTLQRRVMLIALLPGVTLLAVFLAQARGNLRMREALAAEEAVTRHARELDGVEKALDRVVVCARLSPEIVEALKDVCAERRSGPPLPQPWRDVVLQLEQQPDVRTRIVTATRYLDEVHAVQAASWRAADQRRAQIELMMDRHVLTLRVSFVLLLAMIVLPLIFAVNIGRRTRVLMGGVERLRRGQLQPAIALASTDELGQIASALDEMAAAIDERNDALMRVNYDLATNLDALARAQGQMMAAERMEAIATLAAGLSHEINNPLAYIGANVQYVRGVLGEVNLELAEALRETMEGVTRIASIVRDLRFVTEGSARPEPRAELDVRRVLEPTVAVAQHRYRGKTRVVSELHRAPRVLANEGQLGQVFLELIVHAAEGLDEARAGENEIRVTLRSDATGAALVEICDNGEALSPEARARLFEPFAVSRDVGRHGGLGLSLCKRIVEELGGQITADGAPGEGTCVRVRLPGADQRTGLDA